MAKVCAIDLIQKNKYANKLIIDIPSKSFSFEVEIIKYGDIKDVYVRSSKAGKIEAREIILSTLKWLHIKSHYDNDKGEDKWKSNATYKGIDVIIDYKIVPWYKRPKRFFL